jgi:hypothetical protein
MKLIPKHLIDLLPYATDFEKNDIQAVINHGSARKAAKAIGRGKSSIGRTIERVSARAAGKGHAPGTAANYNVAPGFSVKRIADHVNAIGQTTNKWVISEKDKEDMVKQMEEIFGNVCERLEGRAEPVPRPDIAATSKDLAVCVPLGDPHVGLYTWAKEAEVDFDCKIAEKLFVDGITHLVDISPEAEEFILMNLGDFFHSDNVDNRTANAGNALDVDGRFAKVQEIGFWIMINCIDRALTKYPKVLVHNAIGNHDEHTSQALSASLSAWYRNEPRVKVIRNPSKFWYYQWGKCLLGVHHGHTTKLPNIPLTMAAHVPKMWGETLFRYCYLGHLHHSEKKEFPGVTVEQFRTLAPKDAWHWGNGRFISMRDIQSITLHKKYGEVGRRICPVEYLERNKND